MLLLHVSDIHFNHPKCDSGRDPDAPFRNRLIQDVRDRVRTLGNVDAILIGGDIAFKGNPAEYAAANVWINQLVDASRCSLERVFTVPGNHDVDRSITRSNVAVKNAQSIIKSSANKESTIYEQLNDDPTSRVLFTPMSAYNEFAKRFDCQVFGFKQLSWKTTLNIDEFVRLRLHGLTSTILSGFNGGDDEDNCSLYLSPYQTVIDKEDGVVDLVMCHHPPDWFSDKDAVEQALNSRAELHLFGHKHQSRKNFTDQYARFVAAAVNPERHKPGWEPGYNLIRLESQLVGDKRILAIEAQLLVWQTDPDHFVPKSDGKGGYVFQHSLPIYGNPLLPIDPPEAGNEILTETMIEADPSIGVMERPKEAAMSQDRTRNLVLRFWKLRTSDRMKIARDLDLLTGDLSAPEAELYGRALLKAKELNLLGHVAEKVEQLERGNG